MTMLRRRKSPQGRHIPSAFLTMCRGDDQGLSDRRMIPSFSSCRNSALATANFSASSRRKREAMGGPEVLMWCSTFVLTGGRTLEGHTTSSNSAKNAFNHSGNSGGGAGGPAAPAAMSPPQRPVDPRDGSSWPALADAGRRWLRRRRCLPHSALWTPETVVAGPNNGECDVRQKEHPLEPAAMKVQLHHPLTPARYPLAAHPGREWPARRRRGTMRKNAVTCTSINQKTPARKLVHNVYQLPRGDGVQTPPGY